MEVHARKDEVDIMETTVKLVRFLIRNLVWVILFPLIGLAAGYFSSRGKPIVYESKIILRGTILVQEEMSFLILNYQNSGIPGLSGAEQAELKDFQSRAYMKEKSVFAEITCIVSDTTILKKIEKGIVNQLNNEELVKEYFELFQNQNRTLIREFNEKIQVAEAAMKNNGSAFVGYPGIMDLYTRRAEVQMNYDRKGLVQSVTRFKPIQVPSSGKLYTMATGTIGGILALVVFLLIKSFVLYYRKSTSTDASG